MLCAPAACRPPLPIRLQVNHKRSAGNAVSAGTSPLATATDPRSSVSELRKRAKSAGPSRPAAGFDPAILGEIEQASAAEIDAATMEVRNAPPPRPETMMTQVWADGGSQWRN